jgi:hypothetical protein
MRDNSRRTFSAERSSFSAGLSITLVISVATLSQAGDFGKRTTGIAS